MLEDVAEHPQLKNTIAQIEKTFGEGSIMPLGGDAATHKIQGIPWVNTLAVDDKGQTLYMNLSVVPNVSADKLAKCSDPRIGLQMIILDGSNSACASCQRSARA